MQPPLPRRRAAHTMRWAIVSLLACLFMLPGFSLGSHRSIVDSEKEAAIAALLARMNQAQETLRTLRAELVETRSLSLLAEDEVLTGTLSFEKPGRVRWEYRTPEKKIYVLADGELTGWLPSEMRVEKLDLGRHESRIRRLVALGQDEASLRREFRIGAVLGVGGEVEHLVLVPRSRRIRKKVRKVELWIDELTALPKRIVYETGEGDRVDLVLRKLVVNPRLVAETFAIDVPEGCEVVEGTSSFGFGAR